MYFRIVLCWAMAILSVSSWLVRVESVSARELFNRDPQVSNQSGDVQGIQTYFNRISISMAGIDSGTSHLLRSLGISFARGSLFERAHTFVNQSLHGRPTQPVQPSLTHQTVYKIGGEVTGLVSPVQLINNSRDTLWVKPGDAAIFWFTNGLFSGENYVVTAHSKEGSGQYCFISPNGKGVVESMDVGTVKVMCTLDRSNDPFTVRPGGGGGGVRVSQETYTIGGTVSNLLGTLVLRNNGADDLVLNGSGSFIFSTKLANGSNYSVTVHANPGSPEQICEISDGSGRVSGEHVASISIVCRTTSTLSLDSIHKTYGDEPFFVAATGTGDGAIAYTSSDTSVARISGSTVTIMGAGSTTITATRVTSTLFTAASTSTLLTVQKAVPVIAAISSVSVTSSRYSGICLEDFDALTFCTLDTPLRIDLPTSTSDGAFTALTASNADTIPSSTPAVSFVLGYPVMDAAFSLPLAFDAFSLLTPGPFTTVATLHQATTTNYTAGTASFSVTVELTNEDPEGNSCFNHGVMLRTPYDTYECACPTAFTGQYCQTVVPG